MNGYEPTQREDIIAVALDLFKWVSRDVPFDSKDAAAFIEGYLQGKELGGEL